MVAILVSGFSLVVMLSFFAFFFRIYRDLTRLEKDVESSWGKINQLLKQRFDELPKLIVTVEAFMPSEAPAIHQVIASRDRYFQSEKFLGKVQADLALSRAIQDLLSRGESNLKLEANINFVQIHHRLTELEESLMEQRQHYAAAASAFNRQIEALPDVFVANFLGYAIKPPYLTSLPSERRAA